MDFETLEHGQNSPAPDSLNRQLILRRDSVGAAGWGGVPACAAARVPRRRGPATHRRDGLLQKRKGRAGWLSHKKNYAAFGNRIYFY